MQRLALARQRLGWVGRYVPRGEAPDPPDPPDPPEPQANELVLGIAPATNVLVPPVLNNTLVLG